MSQELLHKVETILDDSSSSELIDIYFQIATDDILNYTNMTEVPSSLESTLMQMIVYLYRNRGLENVSSESIGNVRYTFTTDYPSSIISRLDSYKRVTVV